MIITVDQVMSWGPCDYYPREIVDEIIGAGKTPLQILDLDIALDDRFWVLFREEIFFPRDLRLMAADFAEVVLPIFEAKYPGDNRPRQAIEAARQYACGNISSAACDAACNAARAAACDAACNDACAAACAAYSAARNAARNAAYSAAYSAACDAQIEIVRGYLEWSEK